LNTSLFSLRKLRYRNLPDLIDKQIEIASIPGVELAVLGMLPPALVAAGFKLLPYRQMALMIGKYGMLDISLAAAKNQLVPSDKITRELLYELGLSYRPEDRALHSDPSARLYELDLLEAIVRDIQADACILKLFMTFEPLEHAWNRFLKYIRPPAGTGQDDEFEIDYHDTMILDVERRFPLIFTVADPCLTNCDSVWFEKHFYM
jgi:hypothetical protein